MVSCLNLPPLKRTSKYLFTSALSILQAGTTVQVATNISIGTKDPACLLGRRQLLKWVNDLLKVKLDKIESTCSGT